MYDGPAAYHNAYDVMAESPMSAEDVNAVHVTVIDLAVTEDVDGVDT